VGDVVSGAATDRAGVTGALADLALGVTAETLPAELRDLARRAVLDYGGCALAGSATEAAAIAAGWVGSLGGVPEAAVVGSPVRAPAALAALANGVAAHALDLDEYSPTMTHPSVCLVPALLALGERRGASGRELLAAYVAGAETIVRLGRALNPVHYDRGWHATGTLGVIGAAVAAARMLELDRDALRSAVAIAASTSSGLQQNFGSMVKPLHAGHAAFHGVSAAELAARGFGGSDRVLDGRLGLGAVLSGDSGALTPAAFAADRWELLDTGLVFKRYACCGAIHAALDALLALRREHGLAPEDVTWIGCAVNRRAPDILVHRDPVTGDEGRFSLEHSLAVALADGRAGLAQFTDERVADPALRELTARVEVTVDERLPAEPGRFPATVTVRTAGGERLSLHVDEPRGFPANPLSEAELASKFRECASGRLDGSRVDELLAMLSGFDELPDAGAVSRALA